MARRNKETPRPSEASKKADAPSVTPGDALEQRMLAFADTLGRIAGTLHAKAEGWMDRDALTEQIASVRDSAAELLEQLAPGRTKAPKKVTTAPAAPRNTKGRSGGVVDAPGKKHRKPLPPDPDANKAASQAAKMRMAKTMVKTNRLRGRG